VTQNYKKETMSFLIFYVTHPDERTAHDISAHLLDKRLIACANIFPIQSAYWWSGAVQREGEWASILKTQTALEAELEAALYALHPYEIPCFMRFEARANGEYEHWIEASTRKT
jgi:periplasmic divalent cation tolerance protein